MSFDESGSNLAPPNHGQHGQRRGSFAALFRQKRDRLKPPSIIVSDDDNDVPLQTKPPGWTASAHNGSVSRSSTDSPPREVRPDVHSFLMPERDSGIRREVDPESALEVTRDGRTRFKPKAKAVWKFFRRVFVGIFVTAAVAATWVAGTHSIKYAYLSREWKKSYGKYSDSHQNQTVAVYDAPFLTTWLCTIWTILFFPFFFFIQVVLIRDCATVRSLTYEAIHHFLTRGLTPFKFLSRILFFGALWVGTNYLYMLSLRVLWASDVMALYATSVSFVYLLSWVVLHEMFVGVRVVAVILCNTGIAFLAYMDGVSKTPTLGGVVLGAAAATGSAVYKVLFRKLIGDSSFTQVAIFFSLISLVNTLLFWPIPLGLYLTGIEVWTWNEIPWEPLLLAGALSLVANLLGNLGVLLTYDFFITLGLLIAVPLSIFLDHDWYGLNVTGMRLGGFILISCGFVLSLFPENWPDYIALLLSLVPRREYRDKGTDREGSRRGKGNFPVKTLRTPSGRIK